MPGFSSQVFIHNHNSNLVFSSVSPQCSRKYLQARVTSYIFICSPFPHLGGILVSLFLTVIFSEFFFIVLKCFFKFCYHSVGKITKVRYVSNVLSCSFQPRLLFSTVIKDACSGVASNQIFSPSASHGPQ